MIQVVSHVEPLPGCWRLRFHLGWNAGLDEAKEAVFAKFGQLPHEEIGMFEGHDALGSFLDLHTRDVMHAIYWKMSL